MNTFEKNTRMDTGLSGGLIAIGIAWALYAAVQGPVGTDARSSTAQVAANATVSAAAVHRATGHEAAARPAGAAKVS
jgi:hypothetical protein